MKRLALALVPAVLLALAPAAPAAAGPSKAGDRSGAPLLLALGDSVPAGFGVTTGAAYPDQLRGLLSAGYNTAAGKATPNKRTTFEVRNLSVIGATTASLLSTQLEAAVRLIEDRRADRDPKNDVEVVTVTVGGNDVFRPVTTTCLSPVATDRAQCSSTVSARLADARANLTAALTALTAAAGHRTEVVVTTYYDPIPTCFLAALAPVSVPLATAVLEGGSVPGLLTVPEGLNDVIEQSAAATGAQVADLRGLAPSQLIGGADCLHPNRAGQTEIADRVYEVLAG